MIDSRQIVTTSQGGIRVSFDAYRDAATTYYHIWCKSRVLITISPVAGSGIVGTYAVSINDIVYHAASNGVLIYDATDIARSILAEGGSRFDLDIEFPTIQQSPITLEFVALDGIRPTQLVMPRISPRRLPVPTAAALGGPEVIPPNVIYYSAGIGSSVLSFEVRGMVVDSALSWGYIPGARMTVTDNRLAGVCTPQDTKIEAEGDERSALYPITLLPACIDCALLQWQSATGIAKTAVWRLKDWRRQTEQMELQALGDGYSTRAGYSVGVTAYIEGLDAYSYAYYADVLHSGGVVCKKIIANTTLFGAGGVSSEDRVVRVAPKAVTIPNGDAGGPYTLEIDIEIYHYDKV